VSEVPSTTNELENVVRTGLLRMAEQAPPDTQPTRSTLRRARRRALRTIAAVLVGAMTLGAGSVAGIRIVAGRSLTPAGGVAACTSSWSRVDSPAPAGHNTLPSDVAFVSADEAWVVGAIDQRGTVAVRWDGATWSEVPTPDTDTRYQGLHALAIVAPDDVWAVGDDQPMGRGYRPLFERWNGRVWSIVGSPEVNGSLSSLTASGSSDVWAVGSLAYPRVGTLTEHWDGRAWSVVPSPTPHASDAGLTAVAGSGPDDVWAVGGYQMQPSAPGGGTRVRGGVGRPLIEHWNGSAWTILDQSGIPNGGLSDVVSLGPDDAWVVGVAQPVGSTSAYPLIEHWEGTSWTVVDAGPPTRLRGAGADGANSDLSAVAAVGPTDLWAVGSFSPDPKAGSPTVALIEHWDGTAWRTVESPAASDRSYGLSAIAATPQGRLFAVGVREPDQGIEWQEPLIEQLCEER
jgi:hypothetical protein